MTDCTETMGEIGAAVSSSATAGSGQAAITAKLAHLWPAAILGLGLALTIAWNAGLFWLLYSVV